MSTPSSKIYLLKSGNQLTADQHHTFLFADADAQKAWFFQEGLYTELSPSQYIRVSENEVKVRMAKEYIDGNFAYMCIKTSQYLTTGNITTEESRYWYAFIVDTEYVADNTTKITFEVDVLQTFLFDGSVNFKTAHVERCHMRNDVIGDNRIAEPFSIPSYVYNEKQLIELPTAVIVELIQDTTTAAHGQATPSDIFFNLCSATSYYGFNMNDTNERASLRAFLQDPAVQAAGALVSLYTCPTDAINGSEQRNAATNRMKDDEYPVTKIISKNSAIYPMTIEATGNSSKIDGYEPKNNKLFTYPYNVLQVTNTSGEEALFKFEEWKSSPAFNLQTTWVDPVATLIPTAYEKSNETLGQNPENYRYGLSIKDYAICGYASDAYQTWKAQRSQSQYMGLIAKGISDTVGLGVLGIGTSLGKVAPFRLASGTAITAASFGSSVATVIEDVIEAKNKPDAIVSDLGGTTLKMANHHLGFEFARLSVNDYYAEIIDNYFTQFGYAQDKLMDIDAWLREDTRPHYKYIKTSDIHVNGVCPAKYKDMIETIFNRGITFWNTDTAIGDYVDNPAPVVS